MGRFTDKFKEANSSFNQKYQKELNALKGLTEQEIKSIIPEGFDRKKRNELIQVIEQAAKKNKTQAQLVDDIKDLGDIAVKIAKKYTDLF